MPQNARSASARAETMNLTDSTRAIEALRSAVLSKSGEAVAHAAMMNIWPLYSVHADELVSAVESLPTPLLERYPVLRIVHRMTPVLARTNRPFKPLIYPDDARSMSADELDIFTLVQMVAFRLSGDVAAAMIYARRLQDRILQVRVESRERPDGPLWFYHQQIGSTLLAAGESAAALLEFATARDLGRLSQQTDAERMALGRTALTHAVRGSLDDAESSLNELTALPEPTRAHLTATTMTERCARALLAVDSMAPDADELLSRLETYDSIELTWPFALLARSRRLLVLQHPDDAIEAVALARDAHPDQHGSFATDVINSVSIDALWSTGDTTAARRIAEETARSGPLTRMAIIRHALLESRLDVAASGLRQMSTARSLGPGARAESILLSAWLECALTDAVASETAAQVTRIASRPGRRRLVSQIPLQLITRVQERLSPEEATSFAAATGGLAATDRPRPPTLTASELRVLRALPLHATTAALAASLHVSPNTIKSQLRSLYRKLGCSTRDDAVIIASRLHLLAAEVSTRS
ncbi:helix-turn-helix transcriptional regulator [Microbacterium oxydans]|uniref:helix-turn-helix transcriptional regulator n=1 Tax=Microbacterium oxydans TaxID=82380 RepID=UPI000B87A377|nr:LuxR C-terminal-related transcriptional regulator [Microbacterium oxydans]